MKVGDLVRFKNPMSWDGNNIGIILEDDSSDLDGLYLVYFPENDYPYWFDDQDVELIYGT